MILVRNGAPERRFNSGVCPEFRKVIWSEGSKLLIIYTKGFHKVIRALLLISLTPFAVLVILLCTNLVFRFHSISRASLLISDNELSGCKHNVPNFYNIYVSERMANDHLIYAIAANEAYGDKRLKYFRVDKYSDRFYKLDSGGLNGLRYESYIDHDDAVVILAFRGTQINNARDWFANFSWFTGAFGIDDEYTEARRVFISIKQKLKDQFGNKAFSFVTTGHSLGGGLAEHIAKGFPCVDAVVFDFSPVTNAFLYVEPFVDAITIHIYDTNDELTTLSHLLFTERDSPTYRWYPIKLVPCKPPNTLCHAMNPFVIGMARDVVECQIQRSQECLIPNNDIRAQNTYCPAADGIHDPLCKDVLRRLSLRSSGP